jgi:hypothetical protein
VIRKDLLLEMEESTSSRDIFKTLNSTFITTIHKSENPQSFDPYRPISPCNYIYNIIARRLKPIMFDFILEEQFGFLDGC